MKLSNRILLLCFLPALIVFSGSCSIGTQEPPPIKEAIIQGRTAKLLPFLDRIIAFKNTPASTYALRVKKALSQCSTSFVMSAPKQKLHELPHRVSCESSPTTAQATPIRFLLPFGEGHSILAGSVEVDKQGGVIAKGTLSGTETNATSMLSPGSKGPGKKVLSQGELAHARIRSKRGLDLTSLLDTGDQLDNLFHLKSKLFTQTMLDDTIEFAAYIPRQGEPMPDMALAFGINSQKAVDAAVEEFVTSLEKHWSLIRSHQTIGEYQGTCLNELRILPGLAPCIITTKQAFVIGWNAASLKRSMLPQKGPSQLDDKSNISVFFNNFPQADARLTQHRIPNAPRLSLTYPFSKATLTAIEANAETLLELELRP